MRHGSTSAWTKAHSYDEAKGTKFAFWHCFDNARQRTSTVCTVSNRLYRFWAAIKNPWLLSESTFPLSSAFSTPRAPPGLSIQTIWELPEEHKPSVGFESELGLVNLDRGELNLLPYGGGYGLRLQDANHDTHRAIGSVSRTVDLIERVTWLP